MNMTLLPNWESYSTAIARFCFDVQENTIFRVPLYSSLFRRHFSYLRGNNIFWELESRSFLDEGNGLHEQTKLITDFKEILKFKKR